MASKIPEVVWLPPTESNTPMDLYRKHVNNKFSQSLATTQQLQVWTVENHQPFWTDLYGYLNLTPDLPTGMKVAYDESVPMSSNPTWFDGLNLNYAENVLVNAQKYPDKTALIGLREGQGLEGENVTWAQFAERVCQVSSALRRKGFQKGDVVAALVSTSIDAVVIFHASASVGAVFTSISPDLGVEGCVARLRQVSPKILFADSDATYKGRPTSIIPKITTILDQLSSKPLVFVIPVATKSNDFPSFADFLSQSSSTDALQYERVPFNYPLVICYSSGTTGPPKCIVHHHGMILNLKKISLLHNSLGPDEVVLQYSSTSWVMFYIMNGHFSTGATTICYDGSPLWPDQGVFLRVMEKFKVTYLGTSPRYLFELEKARLIPKTEYDLSSLRMVNTTGATLSTDQYRWFYKNFPSRVHLTNSAGGTDTATSLLAIDPAGPVRAGEMQIPGLGMATDVADPETGESIRDTALPGEMVVRKPFPSMPAFFWGDDGGKLYKAAYFERFDNVDIWCQHDWLSHNPVTKGWMMHGRSDGVLNPSGIRFGSGEIYAVVEGPAFNHEISDTLCIGRRRPQDMDETVFLFVQMRPGFAFTDALLHRLRVAISTALSVRHVPRFIIGVEAIPVTINGKKVETAVKQLISGKDIKVSSTVANPDVLLGYKKYRDFEEKRVAKL